jgi:heptosyltransferase III
LRRLLIRPGAIGDCILAFPAMEFLRTDYTEVWVANAVVPLVRFADHVRAIAATGLDLLGIGDKPAAPLVATLQRFDSIVSWYGENRPEFREAAMRVNPKWSFLRALPPDGSSLHATDFFAAQVGAAAGLSPTISVPHFSRHGSAVIHPFSGSRKKNWPLERFQKLAARLDEPVKWAAGPEDVFPGAVRFDDLGGLANWLAGARIYIGNDSGITHLAAAVGTPTVALFGPTDPEVWGPRGERVRCLREKPIEELGVERVVDAVGEMLDSEP